MEYLMSCFFMILLVGVPILAPLIYNFKNKEKRVVLINFIIIALFIFFKIIFTLTEELFAGEAILTLLLIISAIVAICKTIILGRKNKKIKISRIFIMILLLLVWSIAYSVLYSFSSPIFETEEERIQAINSSFRFNQMFEIMFNIPIINMFVLMMFKNKDEEGE